VPMNRRLQGEISPLAREKAPRRSIALEHETEAIGVASRGLPTMLTAENCAYVARTLASALKDMSVDERMPLVLGGGIARRYPIIVAILAGLIPNPTELTAAPAEAKSAAYVGLDYLSRQHIMT
jgi:hypothetical protein